MTDRAMTGDEPRKRRWLRPLGLFVVALGLAVGPPTVIVAVTFSLLTLCTPGGKWTGFAFAVVALAVVFAGEPDGGMWYLERGWAQIGRAHV